MRRVGFVGLAVLAALGWFAAPASAERFVITSFDGTEIVANFFAAEGLAEGRRAPTVFYGPGYSSGGDTNPESESSDSTGSVGLGPLRRAGYNVVTWDPRGFGQSGGTVQVDSPEHEARDVQALIDVVARRPEVKLDAPGDPRMAMTGISYGGGIQFNTAQREPRIDAIAPTIAWHSLITSLFKEGALKAGWGSALCGTGEGRGLADGMFAPRGPQTGSHDPVITRTCANGLATGRSPEGEDLEWFAARGPGGLVSRIRIPTLVIQGTVDTLFTLREAMDNHALLKASGVPLKMLWFCGGHGACRTGTGTPKHIEARVLAWLDRHVRGRDVDTGPPFEWIDDQATWRSADGFPLPQVDELRGSATGPLPLQAAATSGAGIAATPAQPGTALEVDIEPPATDVDVVGEPRLRMTYTGVGAPERTWVYAQVLDVERGTVAGNVATPIPIRLDGGMHTIERPLEPIALRAPAGKRYRVQIVASSTLYYPQQSTGGIQTLVADASLPVVDAAAARASAGEVAGRESAAAPLGAQRGRPRVRLTVSCRQARVTGPDVKRVRRVVFRRAGMGKRVDRQRPFKIALRGHGRRVRATIRTRDGRRLVRRAGAPRCVPRFTG